MGSFKANSVIEWDSVPGKLCRVDLEALYVSLKLLRLELVQDARDAQPSSSGNSQDRSKAPAPILLADRQLAPIAAGGLGIPTRKPPVLKKARSTDSFSKRLFLSGDPAKNEFNEKVQHKAILKHTDVYDQQPPGSSIPSNFKSLSNSFGSGKQVHINESQVSASDYAAGLFEGGQQYGGLVTSTSIDHSQLDAASRDSSNRSLFKSHTGLLKEHIAWLRSRNESLVQQVTG